MKDRKETKKKKKKNSDFLQRMKSSWSWFFLEERCVMPLCRRRTGVLKSTPINQRAHYIEGCGQICWECVNEMEKMKIELGQF